MSKRTIMKKVFRNYKVHIPSEEVEIAIKELTPKAYQLLIYYYSKNDGYIFNNGTIAELLNISTRQLSTYHKELKEKKYLHIQKGDVTVYFIGKEAVSNYDNNGISSTNNRVETSLRDEEKPAIVTSTADKIADPTDENLFS